MLKQEGLKRIIVDASPALHHAVKAAALKEGRSVKEVFLNFAEDYVAKVNGIDNDGNTRREGAVKAIPFTKLDSLIDEAVDRRLTEKGFKAEQAGKAIVVKDGLEIHTVEKPVEVKSAADPVKKTLEAAKPVEVKAAEQETDVDMEFKKLNVENGKVKIKSKKEEKDYILGILWWTV